MCFFPKKYYTKPCDRLATSTGYTPPPAQWQLGLVNTMDGWILYTIDMTFYLFIF